MTAIKGIIDKMTPTYTTKLPISNLTVNYRPFLVKEEKILLIGMEDHAKNDIKEQYMMIRSLLQSCTDINDIDTLPISEVELMFLKLRSKSVNNIINIVLGAEGTDSTVNIKIDLDTINISKDIPDSKIMINDDVGMLLSPPTLGSFLNLEDTDLTTSAGQFASLILMIKASIKEIFTNDTVITVEELSSSDLDNFVQNISTKALEKIADYYQKIPSVQKEVTYEIDGKEVTKTLRGIDDFL